MSGNSKKPMVNDWRTNAREIILSSWRSKQEGNWLKCPYRIQSSHSMRVNNIIKLNLIYPKNIKYKNCISNSPRSLIMTSTLLVYLSNSRMDWNAAMTPVLWHGCKGGWFMRSDISSLRLRTYNRVKRTLCTLGDQMYPYLFIMANVISTRTQYILCEQWVYYTRQN